MYVKNNYARVAHEVPLPSRVHPPLQGLSVGGTQMVLTCCQCVEMGRGTEECGLGGKEGGERDEWKRKEERGRIRNQKER